VIILLHHYDASIVFLSISVELFLGNKSVPTGKNQVLNSQLTAPFRTWMLFEFYQWINAIFRTQVELLFEEKTLKKNENLIIINVQKA